jgi:hypothetical protein
MSVPSRARRALQGFVSVALYCERGPIPRDAFPMEFDLGIGRAFSLCNGVAGLRPVVGRAHHIAAVRGRQNGSNRALILDV